MFAFASRRSNFDERQMTSLAASGIYELRTSKQCRCPAVYIPEVPASDVGGRPPLYEYTYACRTVSSSAAADDTVHRLELDKGTTATFAAAASTCSPCPVKCGAQTPDEDDDEDEEDGEGKGGGKAAVAAVGVCEVGRGTRPPQNLGLRVDQEKDLRGCTCKQNVNLLGRFGVDDLRNGGRPYALQQRPS